LTGITASATATAPESASVSGSLARDDCCGSRCGDHDSVAGRSDDLGCGYLGANDLYVSGGGEAEATLGPLTATASMMHFIQNRSEPAALLI
jgi:hypothetical protein